MNPPRPRPNNLDPASPAALRAIFSRHDFRPRKRLGQNFLISPEIADRIIRIAEITDEDRVFEIGAGAGALTVRAAQIAAETIALEIDSRLVEILAELLPDELSLKIMQADILQADMAEIIGAGRWKALGNLPYYITGPALAKLLEQRAAFSSIVVMVQKEVADRITAAPGSKIYGALSVMLQAYYVVRRELIVKRACFYPAPEVDSAVVSLTLRPNPAVSKPEEAGFERLVRAAFAHRRKTLENSLVDEEVINDRAEAVAALEAAGLSAGKRAETFSIEDFAVLARKLKLEGEHRHGSN